jgi:hypothetical protein
VSQQSSAIRAGSLHPDPLELTQAPQPGQQGAVARGRGGEAAVAEQVADRVDRRSDVEVAVGVNPPMICGVLVAMVSGSSFALDG